jgi:hypothetical protein
MQAELWLGLDGCGQPIDGLGRMMMPVAGSATMDPPMTQASELVLRARMVSVRSERREVDFFMAPTRATHMPPETLGMTYVGVASHGAAASLRCIGAPTPP